MSSGQRKQGKNLSQQNLEASANWLILFREEFQAHGLADIIIIQHRNVCKDGFSVNDEVDAGRLGPWIIGLILTPYLIVFLDLPAPWEAIPYAKQALRASAPMVIQKSEKLNVPLLERQACPNLLL